ncbi:MAG: class I lanthipeptide [Ferruginibacter sp.]
MKKRTEGKLALGKIKIASLSKNSQEAIKGGRPNLTRTNCDTGAPCHAPNTLNCTTRYVICGC